MLGDKISIADVAVADMMSAELDGGGGQGSVVCKDEGGFHWVVCERGA